MNGLRRLSTLLLAAALTLTAACAVTPASEAGRAGAAARDGDRIATAGGELLIKPVEHASFVMQWQGRTIYVDPVGDAALFQGLPKPDLILITHQHPDHMSADTLTAIAGGSDAPIVAPASVKEQLPPPLSRRVRVLANGDSATVMGIPIRAVPAYNITPERLKYHPRGRDNGYVLTLTDRRVYIAGDTEDIPEMRALRDIDVAFVPMNLPYTMTVQQAASAVREFKPRIVYPYHSRGSDTQEFARLVGQDSGVDVRLRDWYPASR